MRRISSSSILYALVAMWGFGPSEAQAQCAPVSPVVENFSIGTGSSAQAYRATAVGVGAVVSCENSVALGAFSSTSGGPGGGTALGALTSTTAPNATAIGLSASASGFHSIAIGAGASTTGFSSISVGSGSKALHDHAVAIGYQAQTTAENQMMFGTASSTYTLAGLATGGSTLYLTIDSAGQLGTASSIGSTVVVVDDLTTGGSTAALSANQGIVLAGFASTAQNVANAAATAAANAQSTASSAATTASGALQRSGGTMTGAINMNGQHITNVAAPTNAGDVANRGYVDAQVAGLSGEVIALNSTMDSLRERDAELGEGIAVAMALTAPNFLPGQTFAVRVGWGNFDGSHAVGLAAAGVVAKNTFGPGSSVVLDGGLGVGTGQGVAGGRAGLTLGW
jgi:hypothetical protein